MNCFFCKLKDETTIIESTKLWDIRISPEQHTLGCLIIVLRTHKEGFSKLTKDEFLELNNICKKYELKITNAFSADWFNYLFTNNSCRHLHVHLIPRYSKETIFDNNKFTDSNFNGMVKQIKKPSSSKLITSLKKELSD